MRFIKSLSFLQLLFLASLAFGQTTWKPQNNVEFVIGSAAGTGTDVVARMIQRIWRENKGMDITTSVMNRPGGGGAVSWAYLSQRTGDAHYLLITSYNIVGGHITGRSNLTFSNFTPISLLISEYIGYAVRAGSPIKSASEIVDILKKDPASLSVGISTTLGGANHIALALFMKAAGIDHRKLRCQIFQLRSETLRGYK